MPFALVMMHRRGVFTDSITSNEIKGVIKIAIKMHFCAIFGHFLFRVQTNPIVEKHVGLNAEEFALKKKRTMDDYLI